MTIASLQLLLLIASFVPLSESFVVGPPRTLHPGVLCHAYLPSSTMLVAVEYFDGSQVVDPVVVSGLFWSSLQANLVSLIIGQLLATLAFALVTTLAASQVSKLGDWVSLGGGAVKSQQGMSPRGGETQKREGFKTANQESSNTPIDIHLSKLALCVLIDAIGSSSGLLPVVGEVSDVIWAPIAALLTRNLFYGSNVVLVLEFAEEILPFTDILPLATLCWVLDTYFGESEAARALGLGSYSNRSGVDLNDDTIVDAEALIQQEQKIRGDRREL